jgi:predicted ABC-type ATPase
MAHPPQFIILGGGNGSGKSTGAAAVLPGVIPYINADEIAKGLPEVAGENKDARASRILLHAMGEHAARREDFAIETTLASRSLAPRIRRLRQSGYEFQLLFFWLESPELNIQRVAERVQRGGHHIPEDVIRRRYIAGLKNFFGLYMPLADDWRAYDNTQKGNALLIAEKRPGQAEIIHRPETWQRMKGIADNG